MLSTLSSQYLGPCSALPGSPHHCIRGVGQSIKGSNSSRCSKLEHRLTSFTRDSNSRDAQLGGLGGGAQAIAQTRQQAEQYAQSIFEHVRNMGRQKAAVPTLEGLETAMVVKQKLERAIDALQRGLVERDVEVRLLLLAALSGEHILLIGPPGTAKSEVGRRLSKVIQGTYFERLLTRFSVPEELFGPLSMRALEEDKYLRQTRGYLPEAEVAFIDEIFKANSAILNTLLTILNERLFDNGSARIPIPLVSLVGASNELPESEELAALYDRFLLRRQVRQVSAGGLTEMLDYYAQGGSDSEEEIDLMNGHALTKEDFRLTRESALRSVRVPQSVIQLLADLRVYLQEQVEPPVYVSDRRLVKAVGLMQVAAYCNGRSQVTEYDCWLLQHVLWQRPEESQKIADWVLGQLAVDDGVKQVRYLISGLFSRACKCLSGHKERLEDLKADVAQMKQLLIDKLELVHITLESGFTEVRDNLWLSPDEGEALATNLLPKLQRTQEAVEACIKEVATLEVALECGCDALTLANLMPKQWADFIRNSPMDEVKPLGTTPLSNIRI